MGSDEFGLAGVVAGRGMDKHTVVARKEVELYPERVAGPAERFEIHAAGLAEPVNSAPVVWRPACMD